MSEVAAVGHAAFRPGARPAQGVISPSASLDEAFFALVKLASHLEPDLVIVAESESTPQDLLFGQAHRRVADTAACPVLTVLQPSDNRD